MSQPCEPTLTQSIFSRNDAITARLEAKRRLCIHKQKLYTAFMAHFDTCYINRHKKICGCEILSQYIETLVELYSFEGCHDLAQAFCNINELLLSIQSQKGMVHFVRHMISECTDIRIIQNLNDFFNGRIIYDITCSRNSSPVIYSSDCDNGVNEVTSSAELSVEKLRTEDDFNDAVAKVVMNATAAAEHESIQVQES